MMAPNSSQLVKKLAIDTLKPMNRQLRRFGKRQIEKASRLIEKTGMPPVILVDKYNRIIFGAYLVEAARQMGWSEIPVTRVNDLDDQTVRIWHIALHRLLEDESWDMQALKEEFQSLQIDYPELDLLDTCFEMGEIDVTIDINNTTVEDAAPEPQLIAVTQKGQLWRLGKHLLFCGDALDEQSYLILMDGKQAHLIITDPPYNVPIEGHVSGLGKHKHREFAQASGEMSEAEFTEFLARVFTLMVKFSKDGSIHFIFMDWRHCSEILTAGKQAEYILKNICTWVKDNGGMGSLYRSRHELVFVFKAGKAPHTNNVQLGKYGRYRTNVWEYPGVNSFAGNQSDLALHPTVKPVAMLADAIKDCSMRGDIVLDPFGGSGSTLIAAERSGRAARLIEIDPLYCDVIIRRWQTLTGQDAVLVATEQTFNQIEQEGTRDE